jgi:tryptophan synthase alpha chain
LTYANLVAARGPDKFMRDAAAAGTDSLLIADVPAIEAEPWTRAMEYAAIEPVLIAAANTPPQALRTIARLSKAYTYCVSREGITGVHAEGRFDPSLARRVGDAEGPPPLFGFGIARADHVRAALEAGAAGAISGTALIRQTLERRSTKRLVGFVSMMKTATRRRAA